MPRRKKHKHRVLDNHAFEHYGDVFVGGVCKGCGEVIQGKLLGHVWTEETEEQVEVPDLDSPEGRALVERHLDELSEAMEREASKEEFRALTQRHEEEVKALPRKTVTTTVLSGFDLSKFEKDGWIVSSIP